MPERFPSPLPAPTAPRDSSPDAVVTSDGDGAEDHVIVGDDGTINITVPAGATVDIEGADEVA